MKVFEVFYCEVVYRRMKDNLCLVGKIFFGFGFFGDLKKMFLF